MSGWKRENGVFVLVLARFRGLEGVRIGTISVFFHSLLFKRQPECIFLRFLRFLAPFGASLGSNFVTFLGFFEHVQKSMIFEHPIIPFGKGWDLSRVVPTYDAYGRPRPGAAYCAELRSFRRGCMALRSREDTV